VRSTFIIEGKTKRSMINTYEIHDYLSSISENKDTKEEDKHIHDDKVKNKSH
jgi:hypothetical protein